MDEHLQEILPKVLGRDRSFLSEEIANAHEEIEGALRGARVLVIGAAGSIGAAFVRVLVEYSVSGLHLVDISESNLAELVRDFRSSGAGLPRDFQTYAIDFGGPEMGALLQRESYDYVLNFAALKHVRSERDPFTLMRLLEVNVLANDVLLDRLQASHVPERVFGVSSDKAVRPASLMGASKAFMERVFLSKADAIPFSSARFANVAFSDGSLLHSFRQRLMKGQPISAPSDVRRYFISHEEAGQLCLVGCLLAGNREIVFPNLLQEGDMMTFSEIAKMVLEYHGFQAVECGSEEEAIDFAASRSATSREWPCHFTASDTSGEKMYEEFVDPLEAADRERFASVGLVTAPLEHGREALHEGLSAIRNLRKAGEWRTEQLIEAVHKAVPELEHVASDKNLDQKM